MLSILPLDEMVELGVVYEFSSERGKIITRSPMSRTMSLKKAVALAVSYAGTNARVTITARGITSSDMSQFLAIWSRRSYFQPAQ